MEAKEKVKDFNIRFNTLFNIVLANTRPTDEVLMEFYITALPVPTMMWVKRSNAQTLQGDINEEIEVENEIDQSNIIPKLVVKMEHLYDLHDKFKKPTN